MSNRRLTIEGLESRQLMAYGDWDQSFGTGGVAEFSKSVSVESSAFGASAVLAPSGKLYLFGEGLTGKTFRPSMVRFNSDNSLDTSFGDQGKAFFYLGTAFKEVQGQGNKFLAIIRMDTQADRLARLNGDGTLDRSFGSDGFLPISPDPFGTGGGIRPNGSVLNVRLSTSDRFLVTVERDTYREVVRFLPDGKLDTTFANEGKLRLKSGSFETATDANGNLYVVRQSDVGGVVDLERFSSEGLEHPFPSPVSFAFNYVSISPVDLLELDVSSDIVVATTDSGFLGSSGRYKMRRFSLDGTPMSSFGTNGVAEVQLSGGTLSSFGLSRTANDGIRIVGCGGNEVRSFQLRSNGLLDQSYGNEGVTNESSSGSYSHPLRDGRIVIVGQTRSGDSTFFSSRYMDLSGKLEAPLVVSLAGEYPSIDSYDRIPFGLGKFLTRADDTFQVQSIDGSRGGAKHLGTVLNSIALQPILSDEAVVLSTEGFPAKPYLTKYKASDFSKDLGFGTSGRVAVALDTALGMKVKDNLIYVWGTSSQRSRILRYFANGQLDTGFGVAGRLDISQEIISDLEFDNFNRMFFVRLSSAPELVAYTSSGVPDTWQPVPLPDLDILFDFKMHLSIDEEGNLTVAASEELNGSIDTGKLVAQRVLANQTIDPNFGINGKLEVPGFHIPASTKYSNAIVSTSKSITILAQQGLDSVSIIAIALNSATNRFELDRSFSDDGVATVSLERQVSPQSITRLNDGSFLVSMFTESGRGSQGSVIRIQGPAINPAPFHNVFFPLDVTSTPGQARSIDPLDVLAVVNHINSNTHAANTFPDVDGDGTVSPLDALVLVNFINANSPLGGEAEGEGKDTEDISTSIGFADQYFASLWESESQKRFRNGAKRVSP